MYYRVAIQVDAPPTWQWKSTALSSLNIVLQWLQYYRVLTHDRLRIFSTSTQEALNEQLVQENQGLLTTRSRQHSSYKSGGSLHRRGEAKHRQVGHGQTGERPPSLPSRSLRWQRASQAS